MPGKVRYPDINRAYPLQSLKMMQRFMTERSSLQDQNPRFGSENDEYTLEHTRCNTLQFAMHLL